MEWLSAQVREPAFWYVNVALALVVSLIAAYLKPLFDRCFRALLDFLRERVRRIDLVYETMYALGSSERGFRMLLHREMRYRSQALTMVGVAILVYLFGHTEGALPWAKASKSVSAFTAGVLMFAAVQRLALALMCEAAIDAATPPESPIKRPRQRKPKP